jgi:hypothetical protein
MAHYEFKGPAVSKTYLADMKLALQRVCDLWNCPASISGEPSFEGNGYLHVEAETNGCSAGHLRLRLLNALLPFNGWREIND